MALQMYAPVFDGLHADSRSVFANAQSSAEYLCKGRDTERSG